MKFFCFAVGAAFLLAVPCAAHGQKAMGNMPMDGMHTIPSPEQLPAPVHMIGIGNSHIAVKATPEAQIWFDQGLTLLHDFWDYESAKAFEQALRIDPQCAKCYWGLAQAEGFRSGKRSSYGGAGACPGGPAQEACQQHRQAVYRSRKRRENSERR